MRQPNPDIQRWCEEKFAKIDAIVTSLNTLFDLRSKKKSIKTSDGADAAPIKKPKKAFKIKAPQTSVNTDHRLPDINAHKNRARFWQARNEGAVKQYRSLSDAEKLERAAKLKAAYEEELRTLTP